MRKQLTRLKILLVGHRIITPRPSACLTQCLQNVCLLLRLPNKLHPLIKSISVNWIKLKNKSGRWTTAHFHHKTCTLLKMAAHSDKQQINEGLATPPIAAGRSTMRVDSCTSIKTKGLRTDEVISRWVG